MEIKAPKFNLNNLYETKTYSDIVLGTITHSIPVIVYDSPGMPTRDPMRREVFTGNTVLHTTNGPINISFPIEASTLFEAATNFDTTLKAAIEEMQAQQLRSKIIHGGGGGRTNHKLNNKN